MKNILTEEREMAKAVATDVTGTMALGVWDFVLPPLFAINLLKHHRSKEAFTLNFMFTKKLALEAAGNMQQFGLTKINSLAEVEKKTLSILSADQKGVYSEKVRLKQMQEIRLLIDHYQKLLVSEGKTYNDMVKTAYVDRESFDAFLHRLSSAEKEVNRAALQLVGKSAEAKDFVARMEKSVDQIRNRDLDNYFPLPE
ncbi:MAG: NF038143 family protein [Dehalococcoidia bacterium]|nr:NF038143 family protein [Dehalococcoidia bacterium]